MKVWLIVMDDHRCDPAYMVMSTKEKAQEAVKEIIEANYISDITEVDEISERCIHEIATKTV